MTVGPSASQSVPILLHSNRGDAGTEEGGDAPVVVMVEKCFVGCRRAVHAQGVTKQLGHEKFARVSRRALSLGTTKLFCP